jgi:hypothetical protein
MRARVLLLLVVERARGGRREYGIPEWNWTGIPEVHREQMRAARLLELKLRRDLDGKEVCSKTSFWFCLWSASRSCTKSLHLSQVITSLYRSRSWTTPRRPRRLRGAPLPRPTGDRNRVFDGSGRNTKNEQGAEMCPVSTRGGTRCVQLVRGEGRDTST